MKVSEINVSSGGSPNHDASHADALIRTGFWGAQAAGCAFLARQTCRIGIAHRSMNVEQPGTWGTIGGAIDPSEDPRTATIREAAEEVGYQFRPGDNLIDWDVFQSGTFRYTTFLYVIQNEFQARLNWEAQGFDWFEYPNWPTPLHFGIAATLNKPQCIGILETEIAKYHPSSR